MVVDNLIYLWRWYRLGGEEIERVFWKQPNIQVVWMWQGTTCSSQNSPLWLRTGGMQAAGQVVNGDDDEERIDQRLSDSPQMKQLLEEQYHIMCVRI